jgi:hypothetical protein
MAMLQDYVDRLACNQHGGIMGYVRASDGTLYGPRILDVFVVDRRLTCVDVEKCRAADEIGDLEVELGFRGVVLQWRDAPLSRLLDCGDMLIGLDD